MTNQQRVALNLRATGHSFEQAATVMLVKSPTVKEHYYRALRTLGAAGAPDSGQAVDAAHGIWLAFQAGYLKTDREKELEQRLAFLESGTIEKPASLRPGASPIERINQVAYRIGRLGNLPAHPSLKAELNRLAQILSDAAQQVAAVPEYTGDPIDDARTALTLAAQTDAGYATVASLTDRDRLVLTLDGHPEIHQAAEALGWDEAVHLLIVWIVRDALGMNEVRYEHMVKNNSAALVRMFEIAVEDWK